MIVQMKDVIKRYNGVRLALDYMNFDVKKGEVVGLLGPNGAGKTTAINAIVGLLDVDEGIVEVFGEKQNGSNLSLRKRIGFVTQEVTVYEDLSAYENLLFFGKLYGLRGEQLKTRIQEVAKLIGLTDRLHEIPKRYSGGMKRRLNIGCALLHEPELIIMDKPTVGIDPQSDIDLVVDGNIKGIKFFGLLEDVNNALVKSVDLIHLSQIKKNSEIYENVMKGIVLYER